MNSKLTYTLFRLSKNSFNNQVSINVCHLYRNFSVTANKNMRFVQFQLKTGGPKHLGAQLSPDGDIFDISAVDSSIPNSLVKCLKNGSGIIDKAKR